jgi:hypothetical protein
MLLQSTREHENVKEVPSREGQAPAGAGVGFELPETHPSMEGIFKRAVKNSGGRGSCRAWEPLALDSRRFA